MMKNEVRVVLVAALCFLAGGACQRSEPPSAQPSPRLSPVAAAPPAAAAPFEVAAVEVGKEVGADKRIKSPMTSFGAKDTIYASVASNGAAPKIVLKARWTYQDGQLVDESSQTIAPTGPAVTEFHVSKPSGWPAGKYKVEIIADGTSAATREFEVGGAS